MNHTGYRFQVEARLELTKADVEELNAVADSIGGLTGIIIQTLLSSPEPSTDTLIILVRPGTLKILVEATRPIQGEPATTLHEDLTAALSHASNLSTDIGRGFQIRFDGAPGHQAPRLIEVEDLNGRSFQLGEWREDPSNSGHWLLIVGGAP